MTPEALIEEKRANTRMLEAALKNFFITHSFLVVT